MRDRCGLLASYAVVGVMAMSLGACAGQKRIKPSRVAIHNYEQFVAQFKRDFPVGTPLQEVMDYLTENQVLFGYIPPMSLKSYEVSSTVEEDGYDHRVGYIQYMLENIYRFYLIVRTDIQVKVYVSKEEKVIDIRHRFVYTGP